MRRWNTMLLAAMLAVAAVVPIATQASGSTQSRFTLYRPGESAVGYGQADVGASGPNELVYTIFISSSARLSPSAQYRVVLVVGGSSFQAGMLSVNREGGASGTGSVSFPGSYEEILVGIEVVFGSSVIFVGSPSPQTIVMKVVQQSCELPANDSSSTVPNITKFVLYVPDKSDGYGFAVIKVLEQNLDYNLCVSSAAKLSSNSQYEVLLILNGTASRVGTLSVNREGGGSFFGRFEVTPGTYGVGIEVALGSQILYTGSPAPQTLKTGVAPPSSLPLNAVRFALYKPGGSPLIYGHATVAVSGNNSELRYIVSIQNSAALSQSSKYGVILTVNGTRHLGEQIKVSSDGSGIAEGFVNFTVKYESYTIAIEIVQDGITVLVGEPSSQVLSFSPPIGSASVPIAFGFTALDRGGEIGRAALAVQGTRLTVGAFFTGLTPSSSYVLYLVGNDAKYPIGTLVLGNNGQGGVHGSVVLSAGNWKVGLVLVARGIEVMQSDPQSVTLTLKQGQSRQNGTVQNAKTVVGDSSSSQAIASALGSGTIPAVINVAGGSASIAHLDPRFSVSIGNAENGLDITIVGTGVSGSRVLLINFSKPIDLKSLSLIVSLDNQTVVEARSVTQLFTASTPMYVVVLTASGMQLLVSIPHFSTHLIQVLQVPLLPGGFDLLLLFGGAALISLLFVAAFARREKPVLVPF